MSYDQTYSRTENVFGAEPEALLRRNHGLIDRSRPVLDIGAGQGRNALFLARQGFEVHAIDPSQVAIDTVSALAAQESLSIRAIQSDFSVHEPLEEGYSAVLIFGLLPILSWAVMDGLLRRIKLWTHVGSLVFATAFMVKDPSYPQISRTWPAIGINSFAHGPNRVRTYLEPGELRAIFGSFEALHYGESMGPEHRHGDGPVERHAMAEGVFRVSP